MNAKFIHHQPVPSNPGTKHARAFTRIELVAVVAGLVLLCGVALPLLGTTRGDSERAGCFNNLRQIGRAVQMWGSDHQNSPPWLTSASEGGPLTPGKPANAWFEYISLSNQVSTPRILACPADEGAKVALDWSNGPNGLSHPSLRANAISYGIGAHGFVERPWALIAADRNMRVSQSSTQCGPAGAISVVGLVINPTTDPNIAWTNGVHEAAGNLLLNDGSVQFVNSTGLRSIISQPAAETSGTTHMFRAR